jgi:hypothetical protein
MITNDVRCTCDVKIKTVMVKAAIKKKTALPANSTSIEGIIYQNFTFGAQLCMALELGHSGNIRNTWKVLECGAGEEWRR